jgi:hypothetical protein
MTKNKVFINEYDIVEIIVHGDQTIASVDAMATQAENLVKKQCQQGKPALILDNLMLIGNVPAEARKQVVARAKSIDYDKLAFVGNEKIIRLGANLILRAIGKGNKVKYFDSYGDAVIWLTAEQTK